MKDNLSVPCERSEVGINTDKQEPSGSEQEQECM